MAPSQYADDSFSARTHLPLDELADQRRITVQYGPLFIRAPRRDHEQNAIKARFHKLLNPGLDPPRSHFLSCQDAQIESIFGFSAPRGFRADRLDPARQVDPR